MINHKSQLENYVLDNIKTIYSGWLQDRERVLKNFVPQLLDCVLPYARALFMNPVDYFKLLEKYRTYSSANFYQEANFPSPDKADLLVYNNDAQLRDDTAEGFRCPSCKGISSNPQTCTDPLKVKCDWKSYGLLDIGNYHVLKISEIESYPISIPIFKPIVLEKMTSDEIILRNKARLSKRQLSSASKGE